VPKNNIVILRGNLARDPYFQVLDNQTPYLRFFLVVERDTDQLPRAANGKDIQRADLIRIVEYGIRAEVDYRYLRKGATVMIVGWNQSRSYVDRRGGAEIRRNQLEVNAQLIFYGRSCNFERGDKYLAEVVEREGEQGAAMLGNDAPIGLSETLLKMLSVESE
jgi:single-stranded DNA-binding protein